MQVKKNGRLMYVLFFVFFFCAFFIMRYVPVMGDDLYYSTFDSIFSEQFWKQHLEHYGLSNGRFIVHVLATFFLKLPPVVWQIANAALLMIIPYLATKLTGGDRLGIQTFVGVVIGIGTVFALPTYISRESIYWRTGSMNYVYPFALLMLFWVVLKNDKGKYKKVLLPCIAFFSAATTEQNSMMTLGITVLYILGFVRKNRKMPKYIFRTFICVAAGFASVYLAPSNMVRYALQSEHTIRENFLIALPQVFRDFVFGDYTVVFMMLTALTMGMFLYTNFRGKTGAGLSAAGAVVSAALLWVHHSTKNYAVLIIASIILAAELICTVIAVFHRKVKNGDVTLSAIAMCLGSQLMMCASPVWGGRTMLCGIFMLMIFNITLLSLISTKKMGVFALCIVAALSVSAVINYGKTLDGYKANYAVNILNTTKIEEYKKTATGPLELYIMPREDCTWSQPHVSIYHSNYYKIYHNLPAETEIIWKEY